MGVTLTLMKEIMCTHLAKRGNRYYFRRKIPLELLPTYGGRKEIMRSLGTSDRKEAEKLARIEGVKLDTEFDRHRSTLMSDTQPARAQTDMADAPYLLANDIVRRYEGSPTPVAYYMKMELRVQRDAIVSADDLKTFMRRCEDEFEFHKAVLSGDQMRVWEFGAHEAARNGFLAFLTGEGSSGLTAAYVEYRPQQPTNGGMVQVLTNANFPSEAQTLGALLDKWNLERKPHGKTVQMVNLTVMRFFEHVGKIPVKEITRAHVVQFKDKLLESGQSAINTNKQLTVINTLLNFARDNAIIESNPASGVAIKVSVTEKPRISFSTEALQAIFNSPIYQSGERPRAGRGEAAYWLPLLALFTGARLEELGQLHPSDVMEERYTDEDGTECSSWIIRIKNSVEDGQAVKNIGSVRRIPIHKELERMGFIEYAMTMRGKNRIFDELVADRFGTETAQFSKWFGRYLRRACKVTESRMTFHSFRHTFKDFCRLADISTEVHHALTGHTSGNIGDKYGGDSYPLRSLVNAMRKYKVPSIPI